jgi:hypothetical protein
MERIAWGKKVSQSFIDRVRWIVDDLHIGDNSLDGINKLMSCIAWESGRTFSASIVNKAGSGATGLIQFMPSTARGMGTTTRRLASMSAEDQLNYVWKYFEPYKGKLKTLADLYMAILWPAAVGKPETAPLWGKKERPTTYRQNSGLDSNTDGYITKAEAAGKVTAMLVEGLRTENCKVLDARRLGLLGIRIPLDDIGNIVGDVAKGILKTAANAATGGIASSVINKTIDDLGEEIFDGNKTVKQVNEDLNEQVEYYEPDSGAEDIKYQPAEQGTSTTTVETPDRSVAVENTTTATKIKNAASGYAGNLAGIAAIAAALLTQPDFTRALAGFTLALSKGEGGFGALIALAGAALIAYKHKPG